MTPEMIVLVGMIMPKIVALAVIVGLLIREAATQHVENEETNGTTNR